MSTFVRFSDGTCETDVGKRRFRVRLREAEQFGHTMLTEFKAVRLVTKYEVVGSIRRGCKFVSDIDIVAELADQEAFNKWIAKIFHRKTQGPLRTKRTRGLIEGYQFDFYFADRTNWGAQLLAWTGPREFRNKLKKRAIELGYVLDNNGLWRDGIQVAGQSEKSIFMALGIPFIAPSNR